MRHRRLGRTGLQVSELTIGTAGLAAGDPDEARAAVALALDRGVNAIELDAGDAVAVALVGAVLGDRPDRSGIHILARLPSLVRFDLPSPHVPAGSAYPGAHLRDATEGLLRALGVERLALAQLHAWCPEWLGEGDWLETLGRLREEGKIAGIGVSLFDHDVDAGLAVAASGAIDAVQAMYNVFDPGAASTLLPLCERHGLGFIARSPLYYGALAGLPERFAEGDWRAAYFYPEHRREAEERALACGATADAALRFALSHPSVSTVAVGMHSTRHVEENVHAIGQGPLSGEALGALRQHKWLCS